MIFLAGHMVRMGDKYLQGVVVGCIRRILKEMEVDGMDQIHVTKDKDKGLGMILPSALVVELERERMVVDPVNK